MAITIRPVIFADISLLRQLAPEYLVNILLIPVTEMNAYLDSEYAKLSWKVR